MNIILMEEIIFYLKLGLAHVLDWQAYDHVLFIIAMCTLYVKINTDHFKGGVRSTVAHTQSRLLFLLVTMFTLGHTLSLFLSNFQFANPGSKWIEFFIPITIIATALFNIVSAYLEPSKKNRLVLFFITFVFGLIHGFGFGKYFNLIADSEQSLALLNFAIGIEIAQFVVVILVILAGILLQGFLKLKYKIWVLILSSIVIIGTLPILINNFPSR